MGAEGRDRQSLPALGAQTTHASWVPLRPELGVQADGGRRGPSSGITTY